MRSYENLVLYVCIWVHRGPISSKRVRSQDPFLRKFQNFSLYSLNFHSNFSSQAPKFWNFQLTSPQNLKIFSSQAPKFGSFQFTSPPFQRQISVRKPHTSEIRATHPYLKQSWLSTPPPPDCKTQVMRQDPVDEKVDCSVYHGVAKLMSHGGQNSMCPWAVFPLLSWLAQSAGMMSFSIAVLRLFPPALSYFLKDKCRGNTVGLSTAKS